jgi:cytochrome b
MTDHTPTPTLVWDLPVRLFHWTLAGGFIAAMGIALLADKHGQVFPTHGMIGMALAFMVLLRLIWSMIGSRYARFGSFQYSPRALGRYFLDVLANRPQTHVAHNPAGSYAALLMLLLVLTLAATGWMMSAGIKSAEEPHELAAYALAAVASVHVLGVIVHTLRHHENITLGMFTGRKLADPSAAIASPRRISAIVLTALTMAWSLGLYRNYDPTTHTTRLPILGPTLQLTEVESPGHHDRSHKD